MRRSDASFTRKRGRKTIRDSREETNCQEGSCAQKEEGAGRVCGVSNEIKINSPQLDQGSVWVCGSGLGLLPGDSTRPMGLGLAGLAHPIGMGLAGLAHSMGWVCLC